MAAAHPPQMKYYLSPEQLRLGLYVFIDLPWFAHPFSFSSFKIRTQEQLQDVRALQLKRIRFDPDLSEPEAIPASAQPEVAAPPAVAPEAIPAPVLAGKRARLAQLDTRREQVANMERAYVKAVGLLRSVNRGLLERPAECLEEVGALVEQMTATFLAAPSLALQVLGEKVGGEEAYCHGLNCTVLALMLAKEMKLSLEDSRTLALGATFHDIGLAEIPDRVLKKTPEELTRPEQELLRLHCEYGLRTAQRVGLSVPVQAIISQHHELADGSGYPQGCRNADIHPLARLISLVNYYDELCNPCDPSATMIPHEALALMFAQRRAKFDGQALQVLIRCLGVYPPGSIVKLSNDTLALVQSVNPRRPLRPWVMLYDPAVPKEEAILLDLEQEPEIAISKALRPLQLEPAVFAYLSPRQRISYYFDDSQPGGSST